VSPPFTKVRSSYNHFSSYGRLYVNGWKEFIDKEDGRQMGDKMLLLYLVIAGPFLFVSHLPNVGLEQLANWYS
jgi:hypothetical protein